jgi:hypothetical protein
MGGQMDFIERLFGVSPDGGDGSLESMYVLATLIAMATIIYALNRIRMHKQRSRVDK